MRDRERHFTKVLDVAEGGQYRNDWDTRITALIAERDAARAQLAAEVEAHAFTADSRAHWRRIAVAENTDAEAARVDVDTLRAERDAFYAALAVIAGTPPDAVVDARTWWIGTFAVAVQDVDALLEAIAALTRVWSIVPDARPFAADVEVAVLCLRCWAAPI